jgi:hypothetical protein
MQRIGEIGTEVIPREEGAGLNLFAGSAWLRAVALIHYIIRVEGQLTGVRMSAR